MPPSGLPQSAAYAVALSRRGTRNRRRYRSTLFTQHLENQLTCSCTSIKIDEHDLLPLGRKVAPGAALLSPRGNVSEQGQNRFFRRFAEGVFDLEDLARRVKDLTRWLGAARTAYGLGGSLDALGFSNGANTAAATLLTQGPVFRRVVMLRGMVTLEPAGVDLRGVQVLLGSGERDPIIPVQNARKLAEQLRAAGAEVQHEVLAAGHELTGQDLELVRGFLA